MNLKMANKAKFRIGDVVFIPDARKWIQIYEIDSKRSSRGQVRYWGTTVNPTTKTIYSRYEDQLQIVSRIYQSRSNRKSKVHLVYLRRRVAA